MIAQTLVDIFEYDPPPARRQGDKTPKQLMQEWYLETDEENGVDFAAFPTLPKELLARVAPAGKPKLAR